MALRIARQLANGLAAIHEHGIVHRDLKLENILVKESAAQEPKCMIVDFGVARSKERLPGLQTTGRGVRFGTLDYMAPEVLNAHPASFASDVYAFGLLIGELMIGRHPCPNSGTRAALGALGEQAVPPLTRLRPEVPPALGEIVDCCVKVQPDLRPTNGHALVLALSRLDELGWPLASSRASNDLGKTRHGVS
jgi:serine/threonine-protein kinase